MGTMIPVIAAEPAELTDADYAAQEALFAQIDKLEDVYAKKNSSQETISDAAERLVLASSNYVEGSLVRNGDAFTWMTEQGIRCGYNPRMRQIREKMVAPEEPEETGVVNEPVATKGGSPSGNQVYLIGPYYNSDDSFTDQYKNEAKAIAKAIGDTDGYTLYADSSATVTNIAKAISNGAVVIFDSHGTTDYSKKAGGYDLWGDPIYDYVSGATNSYLCLSSRSGLTDADYSDGAIWDGYDAYVNGAAIANHMTKNSPSGFLWMAICLGMATDTICRPMREMGVEVVYGYSQSVTFAGDYCYEETFWDEMCSGSTVAEAVATMKQQYGNWDWSTQIASYYGYSDGVSSISTARSNMLAFPVVVSDEDAHPGQRTGSSYGACSLQTVKSTYTIFAEGGDSGDVTEPPETDAPEIVTSPQTGTAYKLGLNSGGEVWYFTGYTESSTISYRLETTTDVEAAVDVYLEQASSGYYLYFMNGSTKTYIRLFHYQDGTAGKGKGSLALVTSKPTETYQYNAAANTVFYKYDNNNSYYMGAYNSYTAISASNTSYITGSNAGNIGLTQYPVRFYQEKAACNHVYDNGEDTSCNTCGAIRTVSSIAMQTLPAQLEVLYLTGSLDVTGGSIKVTYSDGSTTTVAMQSSMVSGLNVQTLGQQTLTVTYGGRTTSFAVQVVAAKPDQLEILTLPAKTSYHTDESLSLEGLTLQASYGQTQLVLSAADVQVDSVDMTTAGAKTVNVSFGGVVATFRIYVHALQRITVDSSLYPESQHNYVSNTNETQTFTYPGASSLTLTFSEQSVIETNYDFLYIYDGAGNLIGEYTGILSGKTVTVPGDTAQFHLTSDGSVNRYGYAFSSIVAEVVEHPGQLACQICGQWKVTAGQTVVLTEDLVASELTIPADVTVDLNGYILLADSLVCFGQIIDTVGSGELWVTDLEMTNNAWLPIAYEPGCYRLFEYRVQSLGVKAKSETATFGFSLNFADPDAYAALLESEDVQLMVTLTLNDTTQIFAFSKELVAEYVDLVSKYPNLQPAMQLNVTGLDTMLEGEVLTVTPVISALGGQLTYFGTDMQYPA